VMVDNAGVTRRAEIMDLTEEDFDRINRVNFKGVFFGLQSAVREMICPVARASAGRPSRSLQIASTGIRRQVSPCPCSGNSGSWSTIYRISIYERSQIRMAGADGRMRCLPGGRRPVAAGRLSP